MQTCLNCGNQNQRSKFCPECGHTIEHVADQQPQRSSILKVSHAEQRRHSSRSGNHKRRTFEPYLGQANHSATERNGLSLISLILAFIANIIQWSLLSGYYSRFATLGGFFGMGVTIGIGLILPSLLSFTTALILNIIGYITNHKYVTLTSAILYGVALLLMPTWGFLGIPSLVLQFIAFTKMPSNTDRPS